MVSKLIKMLDDYGLHIASETERDNSSVTVLTKNLAATIVKPNRHIKVLYAVKIIIATIVRLSVIRIYCEIFLPRPQNHY